MSRGSGGERRDGTPERGRNPDSLSMKPQGHQRPPEPTLNRRPAGRRAAASRSPQTPTGHPPSAESGVGAGGPP